jgi:hypothetical protein
MLKGFGGTFSVISLSVFSCSLFLVNCLVAMIVGNSVWIRVLCTRFWQWAFLSVFCFWARVSWLAYLPTRPQFFFLFFFLSQFFFSFYFLLLFSHSFLFYLLQWIKPWKTRNFVNIAYFWDFGILRNWFKIGVKNGMWHLWCLSCKQYIEQRLLVLRPTGKDIGYFIFYPTIGTHIDTTYNKDKTRILKPQGYRPNCREI